MIRLRRLTAALAAVIALCVLFPRTPTVRPPTAVQNCEFVRRETLKAAPFACAQHDRLSLEEYSRRERRWSRQVVVPLLVTCVGGAGSWRTTLALREAGLHVEHESIGLDGAVSWLYAAKGPYPSARARISPRTRFAKVLHVVRCPTANVGALSTHKRSSLLFAARAAGIDPPPPDRDDHAPQDARAATRLREKRWLRFLGELWLMWNERIANYSDGTARLEDDDFSGSMLCRKVGMLRDGRCASTASHLAATWSSLRFVMRDVSNRLFRNGDYNPKRCLKGACLAGHNTTFHHRVHGDVTWRQLEDAAGPTLAHRIAVASARYGYGLIPDVATCTHH